ncbi:MAG: hypothetical protein M0P20_08340, partial [Methanocorpusculum sp.]|nr:hypothetical protein [Methanocorpusculum sp.]
MGLIKHNHLVFLCGLLLALFFLPSNVEAVETDSSTYKSYSWQNPVYSEQDAPVPPTRTYSAQSLDTASTVEELKTALRYDFDQRITDINIDFTGNSSDIPDFKAFINSILSEDDYRLYSTHGWSGSIQEHEGGIYINLSVVYWTTLDQENFVEQKAQEILAQIILPSMGPDEKEQAIHDYIVLNVAYDESQVEHSAYAALAQGKTVCQGYALLAYKLLNLAGIEARIVGGTTNGGKHAWNLVCLDEKWYHLDCTWDDPTPDMVGKVQYGYYNLNDVEIAVDHTKDDGSYPVANNSYFTDLNNRIQAQPVNALVYQRLMITTELDLLLPEKTAENAQELQNKIEASLDQHDSAYKIRYYSETDPYAALSNIFSNIGPQSDLNSSPAVLYSTYKRGTMIGYWVLEFSFSYNTQNQAPVAQQVIITGNTQVGQILTGAYAYSDYENNSEGISHFQWYRGQTSNGSDKMPISGAVKSQYLLNSMDVGKYIFFTVTPVASHGNLNGVTVLSPASGQVTNNSVPEPPSNEFYSIFKAGFGDATYYGEKTSDGGIIVATDCGGNRRLRLVRIDSQGSQVWDKTYGNDWSSGRCIKQTDGGFIVCGWLYSGSNPNIYLIKINDDGNIVWEKTFGGGDYDYGEEVSPTTDGGYIVAGTIDSNNGDYTNAKVHLLKTDSQGNIIWEQSFSEAKIPNHVEQTSDGGYIIGADSYIIKTDSTGTLVWKKQIANKTETAIEQTSDNGYIVTAVQSSDSWVWGQPRDIFLIKLSPSGNIEWEKTFGSTQDDYPMAVHQTSDGGFIIGGYSGKRCFTSVSGSWTYYSYISYSYVLKTDSSGEKEWELTFGGIVNGDDTVCSIIQTGNSSYVAAGLSDDYFYIHRINTQDSQDLIQFRAAAYQVSTTSEQAHITIDRIGLCLNPVTVYYETSNETAVADKDYVATNGSITFAAGESSKSFSIPIIPGSISSGFKTALLSLSLPGTVGGFSLGPQSTSSLIISVDGNSNPGQVQFSSSSYVVDEAAGYAKVTITRTGGSEGQVSVGVYSSNGSAKAGSDYTSVLSTITFSAGETSKDIAFMIIDD